MNDAKKKSDVLKKTGFAVTAKSDSLSANKENPSIADLKTAEAYMKSTGFNEKQRVGQNHANINIAYDHPQGLTGFVNYNTDENIHQFRELITLKLITEQTENVQVLTEEKDGTKDYFIEGVFLQSELKNHNGRVYPKAIMEREVNRYTEQFINTGRALGELSHPQSCQINPDRVSHRIVELRESGNNYVGKAKILNTPCGQIVKGLLEGGAQLGVSSRGMGTLKERADGIMEVSGDFTLATAADIVFDPSGPDCFVNGILEGKEWIYVDGHYVEQNIEGAKKAIKQAPARQLDEVKRAAFIDFITKNF